MAILVETIELARAPFAERTMDHEIDSIEVVWKFLRWWTEESQAKIGLLVAQDERLQFGRRNLADSLPKVFIPGQLSADEYGQIVKMAHQGFSVLFVSTSKADEIVAHFEESNYKVVQRVRSALPDSLIEQAPWGGVRPHRAVLLAIELGCNALCYFGHDADPILVLSIPARGIYLAPDQAH